MKLTIGNLIAILTLAGMLAGGAMAWQKLDDRVGYLEKQDTYLHGERTK